MIPGDENLERYRLHLIGTRAKQTGYKYHQAATRFVGFVKRNGMELSSLPSNILHAFGQHLIHNESQKPSSAKVLCAGAKHYIEWLRNHDGQQSMPVMGKIDIRSTGKPMPVVLSQDQVKGFIAWASHQKEPYRTALLLLPYTGLRASEMTTLQLRDIKRTSIPRSDGKVEQHLLFSLDPQRTKGQKARAVPVLTDGRIFLLSYLKAWRSRKPGPWLFPSPYDPGKHISIRALRLYVEKIRTKIKAPSLSPHDFRRIYTTTLHRQGVDIVTISRILGHSSIQTTRDHYIAFEADQLSDAVSDVRLIERGVNAQRVDAAKRRARLLLEESRSERMEVPGVPENIFDLIGQDDDDEDDDEAAE